MVPVLAALVAPAVSQQTPSDVAFGGEYFFRFRASAGRAFSRRKGNRFAGSVHFGFHKVTRSRQTVDSPSPLPRSTQVNLGGRYPLRDGHRC